MKRIWMGEFSLESNTFTPVKTRVDDYVIKRGSDMLDDFAPARFFMDRGYEVVPSVSALADPNGSMPLGEYLALAGELLDTLPADGSIDGVWLNLHGAMNVDSLGSGEAWLVSRIREKVGPRVPISVALDLHASISYTLVRLVNIAVGYRTAPHVDVEKTLMTAAELLHRAVEEGVQPWTMAIKAPLLLPGEYAITNDAPTRLIMERLDAIQNMAGVWRASYFTGMTWVDCAHNASTVVVSGHGERPPVAAAMEEVAQFIWDSRHQFKMKQVPCAPGEAVQRALAEPQDKLVFISDSGDNTTAGATGDSALMLNILLQQKAQRALVSGLMDPAAVAAAVRAGVGNRIDVQVGGCANPGSPRTAVTGALVKALHPAPGGGYDGALLGIEGVDLVVNNGRVCFTRKEDFAEYGTSSDNYHVVVVKLGYLYPELGKMSDVHYMAMTEGSSMLDIRGYTYHNQRRPIFPLEDNFEYSPRGAVY